jgi:ribosomal protein S18 acetylase RimI-like enzyme
MPQAVNLIIRDALADDVPLCLALDHIYETDHVWQMHIRHDEGVSASFRPERLPRTLEVRRQPEADRLTRALSPEACFLIAQEKGAEGVLGYLVMQRDPMQHIGQIVDFAVDRPARRCGIGGRLMLVAGAWGREHGMTRLQAAVETTNQPAIAFLTAIGFTFCGFNDRYFTNRDIAVFFSQPIRSR